MTYLAKTIDRVLSMRPDRIGVGRLAQELLAEVTCRPIENEPAPPLQVIPGSDKIGGRGNPWGRLGKPKD